MYLRLADQIRYQMDALTEQYDESLRVIPGYAALPEGTRHDLERHILGLMANCLEAGDDSALIQYVNDRAKQVLASGFAAVWFQEAMAIPEKIVTPLIETVPESHFVWKSLNRAQQAAWQALAEERRRIEAELRESETRYQTIFNSTPIMFWLKDAHNRNLRVNKAAAAFEGVNPAEVEDKSCYDLYPLEQAEAFYQDDLEVMRANKPKLGIIERHTAVGTGHLMWVETGKTPVHNEAGEVIGVLAFAVDITERKQAEAALLEEKNISEAIINSLPGTFYLINRQGQIVRFNRGYETLLGYTPEQIQNRPALDTVAEEERAFVAEQIQRVFIEGQASAETLILSQDGRKIPYYLTGTRLMLGNDLYVAGMGIDISERKQLEDEIQQSLERRGRQVQTSTEVAQEIATATKLEDLFERVVTLIKERFGYYHAQIFRYDPAQEAVVLVSGYGEAGRQMLAGQHRLAMGRGVVGAAAATGKSLLVTDTRQDPDWRPNPHLPETRGELAVPIKLGETVLGILDVQSSQAGALTQDDQLLLEGLCGQIAIAIESTRVLQEAATFRQLAAAANQGIGITSLSGEVIYINPELLRMLALPSPKEVVGRSALELYPAPVREKITQEIIPAVLQTGQWTGELEMQIYGREAGIQTINNFFVIRDEQGAPRYVGNSITDITATKQAEQEVLRFKQGLEQASDAVFMTDLNGHIIYVNPAFENIYGYSREEALGQTPRILKSGQLSPEFYQGFWQALLNKQSVSGEKPNKTKDGRVIIVEDSNSPILDSSGTLLGFLSTHRDITERKQAEEALRRNEAELSEALKIAKLAYWEYDVEKDLFLFNDQFYAIFHTSAEREGGYQLSSAQYAQKFVYPDDLSLVGTEIERALHSTDRHYSRDLVHRIQYADGGIGYISVNINIDRDEQGHILRYYGANQDITASKLVQVELEKFKLGLERSNSAIFITNPQGAISYVNPAFEKIYGYTRAEAIGQTPRIFKSGIVPQAQYQDFWATLLHGQSVAGEIINKTKDGRLIPIEGNNNPILDENGKVVGFLGIHTDITERKEAEDALAAERNLIRALLDTIPDLIYAKDVESRFVLANASTAQRMGAATPEEMIGKSDLDFYPRDLAQQYMAAEQLVVREGKSIIESEEPARDASGQEHWHSTTKVPLRDQQGDIIGLVGITSDITARKHTERELEQLLGRTETLYRTSAELNAAHSYADVLDILRAHTILGEADRNISLNLFDRPWLGDEMPEWSIVIGRWTALPTAAVSTRYPLRALPAAKLLRPDEPFIVNNVQTDPRLDEATRQMYTQRFQAGSTIFVSLVVAGQWIGYLNAVYSEPRQFTDEDVQVLMSAVRQASVVVESTRALEQARTFRQLVEAAGQGIAMANLQAELTYANSALVKLFGASSPAELLGKSVLNYYPSQLHDHITQTVVPTAVQTGQWAGELNVLSMTGQETPTLNSLFLVRDEQGAPQYLANIVTDITERKRAEEVLNQERNMLRILIDNLPLYVYVKDRNSRFVINNTLHLKLLGAASQEEAAGKADLDFFPQEDAAQYYADEQALMQLDQALIDHEEAVIDQTTGQMQWVSTTKVPLHDAQGKVSGFVGLTEDITRRKQAEAELARSAQLLKTILHAVPDYLYVKNTRSEFLLANQALAEVLSLTSADEVIGKTDFDFFPPELAEKFYQDEQAIIRSGQALIGIEEPSQSATGKTLWVSTIKVPFFDSEGNAEGIVGLGRDITERKQAEEVLNQERNMLRILIDNLPLYVYVKDRSSRYIINNKLHLQVMGLTTQEEAFNKRDFDIFPEKDAGQYYADEQALMQFDRPFDSREDSVIDQSTGQRILVFSTKIPLHDAQGNVSGLIGVGEDVTERKRVEAERERLLQEQQRRAVQLQTAAEVSRAASSILNVEQLLPQVAELIRARFDLYYVGLFLLDEDRNWAVLHAGTGEAGQRLLAEGHRLKVGSVSMISQCITTRQARIALDVGDAPVRFDNPWLPQTRSEMALPLFSRGQVIGALTIQSDHAGAFTPDDITVLQTMADQISNAIENARLYEQAQAALREVDTINRRLTGEAWAEFLQGQSGQAVISVSDDTPFAPDLLDGALTTGEVLLEPAEDNPAETTATVPILLRGQPIGALRLKTITDDWNRDLEAVLTDIAGHIAQAVENARLIEQTQRSASRERAINEINARVRQNIDLDAILRTAVNELGQTLKATRVVARVGSGVTADGQPKTGNGGMKND